ncbi:MAG: nucleotidyl transferase AbiEii/AbiGii toxin family protein [Pseudomonadales bacterium]
MSRSEHNLAHLELVADALDGLLHEVTFVGGCTTVLLVDEAALSGVRHTEDVDVIVDVATYRQYMAFSKKLRQLGFAEAQGGPICRWNKNTGETEIKLDVMPVSEQILGFSNRWYGDAMVNAELKTLPSGVEIRVVSPGYFLATKFEAFQGRGGGDYAASHDLEDIVFLLENRTDLIKELIDYPAELKRYIADQANDLLNEKFLNILPGLVMGPYGKDTVENYLKLISTWSH